MSEQESKKLLKEAAGIYLRYRQDPKNSELVRERDAFLKRGAAEQRAWSKVQAAWQATGTPKTPKSPLMVLGAIGLCLASYFLFEPVSILLTASYASEKTPIEVTLSSKDRVFLDAGTALIDDTDANVRQVELLKGAGYFEIEKADRAFSVVVGDVTVEVLGTAFEVAQSGKIVRVAVFEGEVSVEKGTERIQLGAGDAAIWSASKVSVKQVAVENIAPWRDIQLSADQLTFGEVAAILNRRISGRVITVNPALAASNVSGTFDLNRPMTSLRNLAASQSATVIAVPVFGALVLGGP